MSAVYPKGSGVCGHESPITLEHALCCTRIDAV